MTTRGERWVQDAAVLEEDVGESSTFADSPQSAGVEVAHGCPQCPLRGGEDTSTRESLFLTRGLQVPNPTAGEAASRQRGPVSLMIRCQQGIALIDEQTPNAKREDLGRA